MEEPAGRGCAVGTSPSSYRERSRSLPSPGLESAGQYTRSAGWARFARLLEYKQTWRQGTVLVGGRWFPSSKTCSGCGAVRAQLDLEERIYQCPACGMRLDRDLNAAVNLATWAETSSAQVRDPQAWGPATNAHRQERSGRRARDGETNLDDVGIDVRCVRAD
ncbi:zinc ribbon domain-containing protein [Nocardia rhizosphaerihabitans]|uniref:zinc ribbon domain-containing protein n=1 Tax=Nocardia rhizosphaerihabitans TaxID=1691570 RepID=UPI00366FACB7